MSSIVYAKEYEDYLITGKEESLKSLIPGSVEEQYINLLKKLNNEEYTNSLREEIENFIKSNSNKQIDQLKVLSMIKEYEKYPDKKSEIIEKLKKLFKIPCPKTLSNINKQSKSSKLSEIKNQNDKINEQETPSKLDNSQLENLNNFLNEIYTGKFDPTNSLLSDKFNNIILLNVDYSKIDLKIFENWITNSEKYSEFLNVFWIKIYRAPFEDFKKLINKSISILNDSKKPDILFNFFGQCQFSTEQIEYLISVSKEMKFNPENLLKKLITNKLNKNLETPEEKVKELTKLLNLIDQYKIEKNGIKSGLLYTLLKINIKLDVYDLNLFIQYLECPLSKCPIYLTNFYEKNYNSDVYYDVEINELDLVSKYLFHFFYFDNIEKNKFSVLLEKNYLNKQYFKAKFLLDKQEDLEKEGYTDENLAKELTDEINLEICENNKEYFQVNEEVELNMKIKNIQTLFIKLYEINTENYYRTKKEKFQNKIDIEGLTPLHEEVYSFSENSKILRFKKIPITKLPKKRGIYIIEFIGNGLSSRAIIQKGELTLIHKVTQDGMVFFILDEEKNILKGKDTGIWMRSRFFKSTETGAILIPFQENEGDEFLVFKHEDFACYKNVKIWTEKYTVKGLWLINEESFIMGNLCKGAVKPFITCNNSWSVSLDKLINPHLTIETKKLENGEFIPTVLNFDNIKLNNDQEFEFEFQVPPKVKQISIVLSGEIKYKSLDKKEKFEILKDFKIDGQNMQELELQIINDEYILKLIGANGEPKKQQKISVILDDKIFNTRTKEILLETDENGEINLGKLEGIQQIIANGENIQKVFSINEQDFLYPENIKILKGEEIKLPYNKNDDFELIQNIYPIIENYNYKIRTESTDENGRFNYLIINNLDIGKYDLRIGRKSIEISVLNGKKWNVDDEFIITDNEIILPMYNKNSISLENFTYKDKEINIKINKEFSNDNNNTRVHLFAYQYYDKINNNGCIDMNLYNKTRTSETYVISKRKNVYLNNKILNEEVKYVLDRKQFEKRLGNNLDKPSLLLKPQFIRDTKTEIKNAKVGKNYDDMNRDFCGYDECCERCLRKCAPKKGLFFNPIRIKNYLAKPPLVLTNLKPDQNGLITIKSCDLSEYSNLKIICLNNEGCYQNIIPLNNLNVPKRNIASKCILDYDKNYSEIKKIRFMNKEDSYFIKDMSSINYRIFDSIEGFMKYLNLIIDENVKKEFEKFEFLLNFDMLNIKEKLDKVNEFFSHELNIYLYFHYNDFFNEYIYPLIKFKIEKSFIDYFLLNDKENLIKYAKPENIDKLNIFEKCLLIYSLRNTHPKLVQGLSKNMQILSEKDKIEPREINRRFNTAINVVQGKEQSKMEMNNFNVMNLNNIDGFAGNFAMNNIMCCKMAMPRAVGGPYGGFGGGRNRNLFEANEFNDDYVRQENIRNKLFEEPGKTKEFCETHYYNKVAKDTDTKNLIEFNKFYGDLAKFWAENPQCLRNQGFNSENILIKPQNLTDLLFSLAVLDLDNKTIPRAQTFTTGKGLELTIKSNTNCILLTKEIAETKMKKNIKNELIIASMIYDKNDPTKEIKKFVINKPYIQKIIVTNISNKEINCELLIQIPDGSVPLDDTEYSSIKSISIPKFITNTYEKTFYFPFEGKYTQFPISASINGFVIFKSPIFTYNILTKIEIGKDDIESLDDILENGNDNQILEYLEKCENIKEKDLSKIYRLLENKDFYIKLVQILKKKFYYDDTIWNYSLKYQDMEILKEYLEHLYRKEILKNLGPELDCFFIKLDETNSTHLNNHKDYYPVLNSRAHKLPKAESSILTVAFRDTYQRFISYLISLKQLNNSHFIRLCYYLILQFRIEEAKKVYDKIKFENEKEKNKFGLQYDYISAYLDFCLGYPKFEIARNIIKKYVDFPLDYWNGLFNEIRDQLNEFDGKINYDEKMMD